MKRLAIVVTCIGCGGGLDTSEEVAALTLGNLPQRGAFTCDLTIDAQQASLSEIAPALEIDRMQMSGSSFADGFKHKIVPITFPATPAAGTLVLYSGGRYLFDTRAQAATYGEFVTSGYVFAGTLFVERPYFLDADCHAWEVLAASEYIDDYAHRSLRTERWQVPAGSRATLRERWPAVDAEARRRGYAGAWLLYSAGEDLATLVTFDEGLDLMTDRATRPLLGPLVADPAWPKLLDRDHYTLTNWQPFASGDRGTPSAWPNYPLLPMQPACGDQVCEPSRGEDVATCSDDCAPGCGDATCSGGETEHTCPADCIVH